MPPTPLLPPNKHLSQLPWSTFPLCHNQDSRGSREYKLGPLLRKAESIK
jgi:hypothetical protein